MSATFDITNLTFNQWLLVSVIIIASGLLIFCLLAVALSKNFRESIMSFGDDCVPLTRKQRADNFFQELYAIWASRIFDIVSHLMGKEKKTIGREHFLSVFIWVLAIVGISGYFSKIYIRDFWLTFVSGIIAITFVYAEWKACRIMPEMGKKEN
jgi:hypothetical protein